MLQAQRGSLGLPKRALAPPKQEAITNTDPVAACTATRIYADGLHRLRILPRFPQPMGASPINGSPRNCCAVECRCHRRRILRAGSPAFPRRHSQPEHYLSRTLARAVIELEVATFPRREGSLPDW